GEQADHQREAHVIASPHLVQERLVRGDDDVQALQRVADDGPRVRAVGDGELVAAGGAVDELAGVRGNGAARGTAPGGPGGGCRVMAPPRSPIRSARRRAAVRAWSATSGSSSLSR